MRRKLHHAKTGQKCCSFPAVYRGCLFRIIRIISGSHNVNTGKKGVLEMWVVHQRLAELWDKKKKEGLTQEEEKEMEHCLEANKNKALKLAGLYNLSLAASLTDDTEFQHEICAKIDKIKEEINIL